MRQKIVLEVKRFYQKESECGVASCSSLANYYDSSIQYKNVRKTIDPVISTEGMTTAQQGILLNSLGFGCVTIVSADSENFDFSWQKRSLNWKINRLKRLHSYYKRSAPSGDYELVHDYIQFLTAEGCYNDLIIDWNFPKWIKQSIRNGHPVCASINYTKYFKQPREVAAGWDDIRGEAVEHAFVIRGFDTTHIYVVDSQGLKTKKYTGYYKIKWEHFLATTGDGDLIFIQ